MKKYLIVCIALLIALTSCTKSKTPKEAMSKFLTCVQEGKYEEAAKYWDFNYQTENENIYMYMNTKDEEIGMWKLQNKVFKEKKATPHIAEVKYTNKKNNIATVTVRWKTDTLENDIDFVYITARVNGNWKIITTLPRL